MCRQALTTQVAKSCLSSKGRNNAKDNVDYKKWLNIQLTRISREFRFIQYCNCLMRSWKMMRDTICFHLSQHAENETKSRKRWFWLACEHRRILVGYLKLSRFMSVMMVQTKCKLNNTELSLKLFHIQCKEIGNNKYDEKQQNVKNGSEISPE